MPFYLPDEARKIRMKRWLSTRHADSIHPVSKRMEAAHYLFYWNGGILIRVKHERVIVAIRAAKIAVGYEKDRAELAWPIQEGSL